MQDNTRRRNRQGPDAGGQVSSSSCVVLLTAATSRRYCEAPPVRWMAGRHRGRVSARGV